MFKRSLCRLLGVAAIAGSLFAAMPTMGEAAIVEGYAPIENGNVQKAREKAREDAMRTMIEQQVGVQIQSETVVVNAEVVSDRVMSKANGYVRVNKMIAEENRGQIYYVKMDVTADEQVIKTAIQDVRAQLEAVYDENTTRSGVQIAVTERDENGKVQNVTDTLKYVQAKMEDIGFKVTVNDAVLLYLDKQTDLDSPKVNVEVRQIARENREEENAILRGTLSTVSVKSAGNLTEASVKASFELLGIDSSVANSFSDYYTAVGTSRVDAINKARQLATQNAVETLGQKALNTVQHEFQGGTHHIKMNLIFQGITDRNGQYNAIMNALGAIGCRVIRSSFVSDGSLKVFVDAAGFGTTADLQNSILSNVAGLNPGTEDANAIGSTKLYFTF
jgi:hypothetical protein